MGALGLSGSVAVDSDLVASGQCQAVLGAPEANVLVLLAGDDVVVLDAAADGVSVTALPGLDSTRTVGAIVLDGVVVEPDRVLRGAARKARTVFRILAAAEAVGSAWACVEMARDYVTVREQFGRRDRHLSGGQAPRREHAYRSRKGHRGHLGCRTLR